MWRTIVVGLALLSAAAPIHAQGRRGGPPAAAPAHPGQIERVTVRDHEVAVYMPPSYGSDAARRFPVIYVLAEHPVDLLHLPQAADRLAAVQGFSEPIVVLLDASSAATGGWDKFVAEDLVAYADGHYTTIKARISRGLAGYAACGDAALRTALTHQEVFSSLYLMNASIAEASVALLDGSVANLRRYYDIAVTVSTKDVTLTANRRLHAAMTRLLIPHSYEEYDGGNVGIDTRILSFFSRNLSAPANPTSPAAQ